MKSRILLVICISLLVGCSSTANASVSPAPNVLKVVRASGLPGNRFPPLSRTITNAADVQKLYDAALALPKNTMKGVINCPADLGLIYRLSFLHNGALVREMDIGPTGCPSIQVGKNDNRPLTDAFIKLFAGTIGISPSQVIVMPLSQADETRLSPYNKKASKKIIDIRDLEVEDG